MNKLLEHTLLAIAGSALAYYVYWIWRDIQNEKRPPVTEEMVTNMYVDLVENKGWIYEDNQGNEWTRRNGEWVLLDEVED